MIAMLVIVVLYLSCVPVLNTIESITTKKANLKMIRKFQVHVVLGMMAALLLSACSIAVEGGELGRVVNVVDGDTIDVVINGTEYRVRYVGVNTPERDEVCYDEATQANIDLVDGQVVRLVRDTADTDRYGRLLRYIYVGDVFVNRQLIADGYAETVLYGDDDEFYEDFLRFERNAERNGAGCHPTGIFDDGSATR